MVSEARIAVIGGTGDLGFGLALRLAFAGLDVVIGSRRPQAAEEAAESVRHQVPKATIAGAENRDAAAASDLVALCVPFKAQAENLKQLKDVFADGQILLDTTVPIATAVSGRPTRLLGVPQGSAAEQARELAPRFVSVVSALHTVSAPSLSDLQHELDEDVLVAGDDSDSKARVAALVESIPYLRAIDCGRLELARLLEAITPLLISVNSRYKTQAGIRLTGLEPTP